MAPAPLSFKTRGGGGGGARGCRLQGPPPPPPPGVFGGQTGSADRGPAGRLLVRRAGLSAKPLSGLFHPTEELSFMQKNAALQYAWISIEQPPL